MKVLVVGGYGAQGSVICTYLARRPEVSEVVCAGRNLAKAKRLVERLKSDKVSPKKLDATKQDELTSAAKGMDLVVNATVPKYNLILMDAVLKGGAHYQDLASGPTDTPMDEFISQQIERSSKYEDAGLTALINTGSSPGVTNILARHAADKLDKVDEIKIRYTGLMETKEFISIWSPETMWADMAEEPFLYENGKLKRVPPFSGEEVYPFPEPFGSQKLVHHHHEEVVTLSRFIGKGLKYADFKMGDPDIYIAKAIWQIGLLSKKPVDVRGTKVVPREVFVSAIPPPLAMEEVQQKIKEGILVDASEFAIVEVAGEKADETIRYTYEWPTLNIREANKIMPGVTQESYCTGVPAAIFAWMLGRGDIKTTGVIAPECLDLEVRNVILSKLTEMKMPVYEKMKRTLS
ncbi:MAG: saccharopine dehydrogenase NADP-binding domain-containing protein [Candidatus Bathyarchaeota archaeon]|nr:MAG: saccharopine dehydrogenase NADP-binding domain-containing protein [Candidatus Bathyarchaeota archaeon]